MILPCVQSPVDHQWLRRSAGFLFYIITPTRGVKLGFMKFLVG